MNDGRDAPIEPLRSIEGLSGGRVRTRGELVLLPRIDELAEPRREATTSDPARDETDRIIAESGRYRLAVMRRARKRLEGTAGSLK